jgi:hypothetical protein
MYLRSCVALAQEGSVVAKLRRIENEEETREFYY